MKKVFITLIFAVLMFAGFAQTTLDSAENFTVKDVYGNTINLYDLLDEDKIVVIDFFSTA